MKILTKRNSYFQKKTLIGFRRLPNLRDMLTSNKINYPPKPLERDSNALPPVCTRLAKCTYCPQLNKIDHFTSTHTKHKYWCNRLPPKHRLTCEIYNVIYLIHSTKCIKQYIGETGSTLHFTTDSHSYKHMKFSVIKWLGNNTGPDCMGNRRRQKLKYMWNVPTVSPIGINQYV